MAKIWSVTGGLNVKRADVRTHLDEKDGVLALELEVEASRAPRPDAFVEASAARAPLKWITPTTLRGDVRLENVAAWWPHSEGKPALHPLRVVVGEHQVDLGRVGFRALELDDPPVERSFSMRLNGEEIFVRGGAFGDVVVAGRLSYAPRLRQLRDEGMNLVQVSGTTGDDSEAFFSLCDELGLLVWLDFISTDAVGPLLERLQTSPALAVVCGGNDVASQVLRIRPDVPWVSHSQFQGH